MFRRSHQSVIRFPVIRIRLFLSDTPDQGSHSDLCIFRSTVFFINQLVSYIYRLFNFRIDLFQQFAAACILNPGIIRLRSPAGKRISDTVQLVFHPKHYPAGPVQDDSVNLRNLHTFRYRTGFPSEFSHLLYSPFEKHDKHNAVPFP